MNQGGIVIQGGRVPTRDYNPNKALTVGDQIIKPRPLPTRAARFLD